MAGISLAGKTVVINKGLRIYLTLALSAFILALGWKSFAMPTTTPHMFGIHFYQHVVGNMDGRSCPAYPVCSLYTRQALEKHGWLVGSWLALDRLIHEADDLQSGPWIAFEGETRLYDPLSRNDFWLNSYMSEE
jgi:putative component of membrane protein insertase Oxa1/YidC/SpoIIIJ protein YidD